MDRLLGHLAQFGSFWSQGELLCTQGLAFLLGHPEGDLRFTDLISSATGRRIPPGLNWRAEALQEDGRRPDLEGRDAADRAVVKVEAKLGAPFSAGQLESYVSGLCSGGQGGTLLVLVPKSRLGEAAGYVCERFEVAGSGPWRISHDGAEVPCAVLSWEQVLGALSASAFGRFQDDLSQFRAMYRVLAPDHVVPPTQDAHLLRWREEEASWELLAKHVTRVLTAPGDGVLPFGEEGGVQRYRRRYVCRLVAGEFSCYSVGTRDPFEGHRWPLWLRFRRDTADFRGIVTRLGSSDLKGEAVNSEGHLWFELELPQDSEHPSVAEAVDDLVKQVQRILAVAYPQ